MKYFGTDGIRGKAYEFIDFDLAYSVGRSMDKLDTKMVIIARDTRESGLMISKAIKKGVIDAGLKVLNVDIVATPILAHLSIVNDCFGIMVTASHNPYMDNGIKVFNRGRKTTLEEEQLIEEIIDRDYKLEKVKGGFEAAFYNPLPVYFDLFKDFITTTKLRIALDLANGAAITSAKYIFNQISEHLEFIGDAPNGYNINKFVGSTHVKTLAKHVVDFKCDLGFSFDGDGDRLIAVDNDGRIIDGDLMIYIIATYLKEKDLLDNNLVVLTKMSNLGIIDALNQKGIEVIQTDVGDKYVVQALTEKDAIIGGENSGHIINRNLFISGDGVLNAAFLVKILEEKKSTFGDLLRDVNIYPDKLVNLEDIDKTICQDQRLINLVNELKEKLGTQGKLLVRPSGTEPLIRISAQAKTEELMNEVIDTVILQIKEISKERE